MTWRPYRLEFVMLARALGLLPVATILGWVAVASIQEPSFFRSHEIPLLHASVYALADLWSLAMILMGTEMLHPARPASGWPACAAMSSLAILLAALAGTFAAAADLLRGLDLGAEPAWGLLRAVLVWLPVSLWASAIHREHVLVRWCGILLAAAAMLAANPPSAVATAPALANFTTCAAASLGGVLAAMRQP